ncbi:MAG: ABC transporter permease [Dehalococcoidales bacterium]|nr:ABC transporter permease [Dehalococcoidales bacterium]
MHAYIIRRLLLMLPSLLMVTLIVFFLVRFIPGDVIDIMVVEMTQATGAGAAEKTAEALRTQLGLDKPVYLQYWEWLTDVLRGDLGSSLWTRRSVGSDILRRLPVSSELGILGMAIALIMALPIGVYSAIRQDTAGDYFGRSLAILFISVPYFWLGTVIVVYPSVWWGWMPPMRYIPLVDNPVGNLKQFIIPAFVVGTVFTGTIMRMTRTMMLEVLRQDYIRTAWAKGLSERVIVLRHALKNALIPVVTILGMQLPIVIAGAVVTETIFALPGIGFYLLEAIGRRDYPVISGINLIVASFVVVINLLVDITYAYLDPRIHYK